MKPWHFSYTRRWYITHPWAWVDDLLRNVRWAAQRVFRGYDDTVIWSIDWYLCQHMPEWLRTLKEDKHGYPASFEGEGEEKAWEKVLDDMIAGFEAGFRLLDDPPTNPGTISVLQWQWSHGMDLFKEHFFSLWD